MGGSIICYAYTTHTNHLHHHHHHQQRTYRIRRKKERQRNFMQIYLYVGYTSTKEGDSFFFFFFFSDQIRNEMYSKKCSLRHIHLFMIKITVIINVLLRLGFFLCVWYVLVSMIKCIYIYTHWCVPHRQRRFDLLVIRRDRERKKYIYIKGHLLYHRNVNHQ